VFLIVGRKRGKSRPAISLQLPFVRDQRFKADAAVSSHAAVCDSAFLEELDQRRPGDIEHVSKERVKMSAEELSNLAKAIGAKFL
jgi:hypothetical protein